MRIAIISAFPPSIGGIESVADLLAHEFVSAGHTVEVVASNTGWPTPQETRPFQVFYQPAPWTKAVIYARSDCILQFNLGVRSLWPDLFALKPVVVSHQGIYDTSDPDTRFIDRAKHFVGRFFTKIAASDAVAQRLRGKIWVIPNCYDAKIFSGFCDPIGGGGADIICVARLIPQKGVDLLLEALAMLRVQGIRVTATVVGDGPCRGQLIEQARQLGLTGMVAFRGAKSREEVALEFRQHRVAVIPSRYEEAFGIVALEALASGCYVVASNRGGLPEAVGPCGILFDPSKPDELARAIMHVLKKDRDPLPDDQGTLRNHLYRHSPPVIAREYLE